MKKIKQVLYPVSANHSFSQWPY